MPKAMVLFHKRVIKTYLFITALFSAERHKTLQQGQSVTLKVTDGVRELQAEDVSSA